MGKLSDKQINLIYLGIGVAVFLIFAVMSYFDYEEIGIIKKKHQGVNQEISQATAKKKQLAGLKDQLWLLNKKYEEFRTVLPAKKDFVKFYVTLEQFRVKNKIRPWSVFKLKDKKVEENPDQKKKTKQPTKKKSRRSRRSRRGKKTASGPFEKVEYVATIPLTFHQLGLLLNFIENYEQFYGISSIRVPNLKIPRQGKKLGNVSMLEPSGDVQLDLVSFSYNGSNPLDAEVKKILEKHRPSKATKKMFEAQQELWSKKNSFIWKKPLRNPFNKEEVLIRADKGGATPIATGPAITAPPPADQLKTQMKKLEEIRDYLHTLSVAESWIELDSQIKEKKYELQLKRTVVTPKNDPQGETTARIAQMLKELKEWKKLINEADRRKKARQLVEAGAVKVKQMKDLYEKGRSKGDVETLKKVIAIHNALMPDLRAYKELEPEIPGLMNLRTQAGEYYSKADTQMKIIQLAAKLNLKGIIFMKKKPEMSRAFIDKKVVKKNDILMMGFVVHDIQEEKVILRYKEETVPIPLRKNKGIKKIRKGGGPTFRIRRKK